MSGRHLTHWGSIGPWGRAGGTQPSSRSRQGQVNSKAQDEDGGGWLAAVPCPFPASPGMSDFLDCIPSDVAVDAEGPTQPRARRAAQLQTSCLGSHCCFWIQAERDPKGCARATQPAAGVLPPIGSPSIGIWGAGLACAAVCRELPRWQCGQCLHAPARRAGKGGWRSLPSGPPYSSAVAMALRRCCQEGGGGGLRLSPLAVI